MNKLNYLYTLQASLSVLSLKIKNAHWHLQGETFFEVHEELDKLHEEVSSFTDEVAEKLVMFDMLALGSYQEVLKQSLVSEVEAKHWSVKEVSTTFAHDLKVVLDFIGTLENIDFRVQPVLDEIVLMLHKKVWMFSKLSK
ncbi:Dps family protein [Mycoplasmopsis alligatoris]|uniref:Ferritin/DPS domain-containing protein n=1 Tax=Mycoplasmopsis alligatoris A21JP2 TaxID=747682 RepID=D4XWP1_9BACT|nr:DNA starvation/stationary phase protection protein [Mycoplasmopsis alligatoris]EFF41117.1 conserved hypothetical protein [Mycoplasmopsis alligatoris A21JP2]